MIVRLGHICFQTNRFEEMTTFYRDTLDLPVKFSLRLTGGKIFGHYFTLGETSFLELFDQKGAAEMWGGTQAEQKVHTNSTYKHFCIQVVGIDAIRESIIQKGCPVTEVQTGMDGSMQAWIKDPDGNDIELMEYTEASLQTKE